MTPVELEAALDRTLRGDQGAAQGIIEHNKRLELINYDYRIGNTSLTASCHSFDMQVADLTLQLTQAKQERDKARQIVARVNNDVIGSEGYFVEPSCVDAIEALKSHSNRLQQQLATVIAERDDYKKRAEWKHVHDDSLELELQNQLAQAQQDLADLPTLRKDLSMCLIQLQEARGSILSMESEVDMVRAQLAARRA